MEIKFKRFNPQTDIIKPFDCGDSDLNGFLLESNEDVPNATQHAKQLLAVTYILIYYLRVDLSCADVAVAEELGDGVKVGSVGQCEGCKGVTADVE